MVDAWGYSYLLMFNAWRERGRGGRGIKVIASTSAENTVLHKIEQLCGF